jgi:hypothetical protein
MLTAWWDALVWPHIEYFDQIAGVAQVAWRSRRASKRNAQFRGVGFDCESSLLSDGGLVAPSGPCEVGPGGGCGAES